MTNAERWDLAKKGRFEDLPPERIKTYEYIRWKYQDDLHNIWIFGPSGAWKSRLVRDNYLMT